MMTESDIERIKRGPNDLEEIIDKLTKQKELLKTACKKAGARIKELETELATIKGIGINSPEMRAAKARIEELERDREILKGDIDRLSEDKFNLETLLRTR